MIHRINWIIYKMKGALHMLTKAWKFSIHKGEISGTIFAKSADEAMNMVKAAYKNLNYDLSDLCVVAGGCLYNED